MSISFNRHVVTVNEPTSHSNRYGTGDRDTDEELPRSDQADEQPR
jgi:hypothetical protein